MSRVSASEISHACVFAKRKVIKFCGDFLNDINDWPINIQYITIPLYIQMVFAITLYLDYVYVLS